jgi:hypothetical protein
MQPIMQAGFLGLSAVLLVIIVWLITRLLKLLEDTSKIISDNTHVISGLNDRYSELTELCGDIRDRLLSRPCIADHTK